MTTKEMLDQAYLENKVNAIIEPMILRLVSVQPKKPVQFMLNWIKQNHGDRPSENRNKRFELEFLRKEFAKIDGEEYKGSDSDSSESDSDSEESEGTTDAYFLKAREKIAQKGIKPRPSVSAEAYGEWNKKEHFKPKVIKKDEETKDQIRHKISKAFMFNNLSEDDLNVVIDAMRVVNFKEGDWVIKQGEDGDELYVVGSGKYACTKVFPGQTDPTHLLYYKAGQAFGELCLLYNSPRAASIQCLEAGTLYGLDRATFNHIVKDAAVRRREKYEQFLSSIELLQGMEPYERTSLADAVVEEQYKKGDYVIRQGDEGDRFFFIVKGEATASKRLQPGKALVEVMQYNPGSYFGELALIHDAPRAANVIAKTDLTVVSLDKDTFKRIMGSSEELLQRNMEKYEQYGKLDEDVYEKNRIN